MNDGKRLIYPLLASLTLGLAPFVPQPHVLEKVRWLLSGRSLAPIDWFDLFLHGTPWVWLIVEVGFWLPRRLRRQP